MRFNLLACRMMASLLGLALAATAAACSSSGSSSATSPASTSASVSAPASSSAPATSASATSSGNPSAVSEITTNWETFFSSSTPVSRKVALLQNGSTFQGAINDFVNLPVASGIGAKVTAVVVNSATSATVSYDLTSGGTTVLSNQTGTSVNQDGIWKVADASLCALLKLIGGSVPAACSSVG